MRNHDSEIYHRVNFKKTEEIAIARESLGSFSDSVTPL